MLCQPPRPNEQTRNNSEAVEVNITENQYMKISEVAAVAAPSTACDSQKNINVEKPHNTAKRRNLLSKKNSLLNPRRSNPGGAGAASDDEDNEEEAQFVFFDLQDS